MVNQYKTCLLLEDDPEDQEFFLKTLHAVSSKTGCYAVSNGEEALSALQEEGITPDYIFTDIQMPRMNGFEFLKRLRSIREYQDIPVVVYSSTYSEDLVAKLKMLGATAFYSKTRYHVLPEILRKYFGDPRSRSIL